MFIGKVEGEVFRQHLTNISPTPHFYDDDDYDYDHDDDDLSALWAV